MLKSIIIAGGALAASLSLANAEMYTYTVQSGDPTGVGGVWPDGRPFGASHWEGEAVITWANGQKVDQTYSCIGMTQTPGASMFHIHIMCDHSDDKGAHASAWGCNYADEAREKMSCVGGLAGKTGDYEGKFGNATFAGGGGEGAGTGQWND